MQLPVSFRIKWTTQHSSIFIYYFKLKQNKKSRFNKIYILLSYHSSLMKLQARFSKFTP